MFLINIKKLKTVTKKIIIQGKDGSELTYIKVKNMYLALPLQKIKIIIKLLVLLLLLLSLLKLYYCYYHHYHLRYYFLYQYIVCAMECQVTLVVLVYSPAFLMNTSLFTLFIKVVVEETADNYYTEILNNFSSFRFNITIRTQLKSFLFPLKYVEQKKNKNKENVVLYIYNKNPNRIT